MTHSKIDLASARSHWHRKQGLGNAPLEGGVGSVVGAIAWIRTLGGADVYVTAKARVPSLTAAKLDAASSAMEVQVLPAARGCMYLVPRAHAAIALAFASAQSRPRFEKDIEKAGGTWKDVETAGKAVEKALAKGPLSTDAIRKAIPAGTIASYGEKGKKAGTSSALPTALRILEFEGRIERTLENGRLDVERYVWRASAAAPKKPADANVAIVELFVAAHGPVSAKEIAEWTGLAQRDVKAALEKLPVVAVSVEGHGEGFVFERELSSLTGAKHSPESVALLGFEDPYLVAHGGLASLADPAHHDEPIAAFGTIKATTVGAAKHVTSRSFLVGDAVAGLWELDIDKREIVLAPFGKLARTAREKLHALGEGLVSVMLDELGHGKTFSLDNDEAIRKRVTALRKRA